MKLNTRQVTHAALLVALSIVFTRLVAVIMIGDFIRLSFGTIPIYMAGILFGPVVGGLVGGLADGIGFFVNSFGGVFVPHIFLASIMRGIIPALVIRAFGESGKNWALKVTAAIIATELVSGVLLTTLGVSWLNQLPFHVNLLRRLPVMPVQIVVYSTLTYMFTARLRYYVAAYQAGK